MQTNWSEYLTAEEVAAVLRVNRTTIIRKFANRPGVIDLGAPETKFKRRYRVLRIPRECLERYIIETQISRSQT